MTTNIGDREDWRGIWKGLGVALIPTVIFWALLMVLIVMCAGCTSLPLAPTNEPVKVSLTVRTYVYGTSIAADNGVPLTNAIIRVRTIQGVQMAVTSDRGETVVSIQPGQVSIRAEKAGYRPTAIATAEVLVSGETWSFWLERYEP